MTVTKGVFHEVGVLQKAFYRRFFDGEHARTT